MTREEAKKAFREVAAEEFAHIPEEDKIEYEFSGRFNEKNKKHENFIESLFSENTTKNGKQDVNEKKNID